MDDCDDMQSYIDGITNTSRKLLSIGFNLTDEFNSGGASRFDGKVSTDDYEASPRAITADEIKY